MSVKVVVTGFGPFGIHEVNASWEAVRLLPDLEIPFIDLIIDEIPVTYKDVEAKVQEIWTKHSPTLVVHVGVSKIAEKIEIETTANRMGYIKEDCLGNLHPTGECCTAEQGVDAIECGINVEKLCQELKCKDIEFAVSNDVGSYLCGYLFYNSLKVNRNRAMFVHVPILGKPYSAQELALGLKNIIEGALGQLGVYAYIQQCL